MNYILQTGFESEKRLKLLIKNGTIISGGGNKPFKGHILINRGMIEKIFTADENLHDMDISEILDAEGLYVFPGLIDVHCHLRDPGQEYKEDIYTGTRAAAKGGFTSVACMPNTVPPVDTGSMVKYITEVAKRSGAVRVFPIGAITKGQKGDELAEMGDMKENGAVAVSDDGKPVMSSSVMKKALQYSSMFGLTVISHCEDKDIAEDGLMNEGYNSTVLGLRGIPSAAEDLMVSRELILAEYTGVPVHIAHVSTKGSVEMIRQAKKRGVKVSAETCPHYFSLTDDKCLGFNTMAKVNPPLRSDSDVDAVIQGLLDGSLDIVATDHAPHHFDEKNTEFQNAANGVSGFETAFAVFNTYLVNTGIMSLEDLVSKMSTKPAEILKIPGGFIKEGCKADMAIGDTNEKWTVKGSDFISKGKNTPYEDMELFGRIKYTIVDGIVVYKEDL